MFAINTKLVERKSMDSCKCAIGVLIVLAPIIFTLTTGNIWEDFFITYRCSLNLVHGNGLVFEAGRKVHAFTSPLGTLLPAGMAGLLGTDDPLKVMAVFRVIACLALAGAWWLAAPRLSGRIGLGVAGVFWALDAKVAAFSTNGMETALLILFVVMAWRALVDRRPVMAGIALGGAMWTRPDGFIFVGALAIGASLFRGPHPWRFKDWLGMAAVAAAIYTPWFVWAWGYYGSPVPHTVVAKGAHLLPLESLRLLATYPFRYFFGHCAAHDAFLPAYFFFGEWPGWLPWFGHLLALGAVAAVLWPRCGREARVAGLAFVLGGIYLTITTRAPWYFPAWSVLAYLAVGDAVSRVWAMEPPFRWARSLCGAVVTALIVAQAWLFVAETVRLHAQQRLIEWGVRAPLGRDLQQAARGHGDTVFLEPLGYIGFYSGLAMRDTPGLCAPEVVRLRKAGMLSMAGLVAELRPDWAVLRASEYAAMNPAERRDFERRYRLTMVRDVREEVNAVPWLPGRDFLLVDAYFTVWRRRSALRDDG